MAASILRLSTEKRSSAGTSLKENWAPCGAWHVPPAGTGPAQRQVLGFAILLAPRCDLEAHSPMTESAFDCEEVFRHLQPA